MTVKTIETRAVISAQDRTGATFASVANKLRSLESTAASATRRLDRVSAGMSAVGAKVREHQDIARRMSMAAPVAVAAGSKMASARAGLTRIRDGVGDFASAAIPGYALGAGGATLGGLAVGGAGFYALREAVTFEKAMADVKKKVTLDAGASWDDVEAMINKTARSTGLSRESVAALAAQAGQAGVAYKDLAGFMDTAAKAASAWDIDAKESAQTLSQIRAQTGWTNKELSEYADKVNYLGDISAAAEKNISEMWARASEGAKAAGLNYDDSMVFLTAMRGVGMDKDVSARALGAISTKLRIADSLPKGAKAALQSIGLRPKDVEQHMRRDGAGTLLSVLDRINKSRDSAKVSQELFGAEWSDEAQRLAGGAREEAIRLRKALASGDWKGSTEKSFQEGMKTTQSHWDRTKNLASELADKSTRGVLPYLNSAMAAALDSYDSKGALHGLVHPIDTMSDSFRSLGNWWTGAGNTPQLGPARIADMHPFTRPIDPNFRAVRGRKGRKGFGPKDALGPAWAVGQEASSVAPGLLAFGAGGASGNSALNFGPARLPPITESVKALMVPSSAPAAKLEGSAEITNRVIFEPSRDLIVRIEQAIRASGALRPDVGISMPPRR